MNEGMKVTQVVSRPPMCAAEGRGKALGMIICREVSHELVHHDERARRGLRQTQAVHHLLGHDPVVMAHGLLADVAEHGIGAAEGHDRCLAEQDADIDEGIVPAPPETEQHDRQRPQGEKDEQVL